MQASPAPQGRLAFWLPQARGLLVTDLQGRSIRTIRFPPGRKVVVGPRFGPGGRRLWFVSGTGASGLNRLRLHAVPAVGRSAGSSYAAPALKGVVLVHPASPVTGLLVAPDESRVAIGGDPNSGGCWPAAVISSRGRSVRRLAFRGNVQVNISPWSPKAGRLIYTVYRWGECGRITPNAALYLTRAHGAGPDRRLAAQRDGTFSTAAWSPDERQVAFNQCDLRASTSSCPLVVVNTATGRQSLVARDSYPGMVVWAARTNEVVASRGDPSPGVWAFKSDGSGRRPLPGLNGADIHAGSADGNRLLGFIYRAGYRVVEVESGRVWSLPAAAQRRFGRTPVTYFLR